MYNDNVRRVKRIHKDLLLNAQSKLDELIELLEPCLVSLTASERKLLDKIGSEYMEFLELSYEMVLGSPELFPASLKASSFGEKLSSAYELWVLINKIDNLRNNISDTKTLIGNHAMENALAFYNSVKIAARRDIPGARAMYEELKPAFPPRRK